MEPNAEKLAGSVVPYHERFVDNAGVKIRFLDNDPPAPLGLPVVFVPGITDFADDYAAALEDFGARRLLVVEMRGRGGSDAPSAGYSAADQAGDVEAVVQATGLERFHLMTFSRGTTPALEVALAHPQRVVTVSIGDYPAREIFLPPEFVDNLWATTWRGKPMASRVSRHVLQAIHADAVDRDLWSDLASLGVPVLVARGEQGGLVDDHIEDLYRRSVPGVEMVVIPGSEHDLFRPSRTMYPQAVREFIDRRAPGT